MRADSVFLLIILCVPFAISASEIEFSELVHENTPDFDAIESHSEFAFTNTSSHQVTISGITTSCGCTTAELEKKTYLPGESGKIEVDFTIGSRSGEQEKVIRVTTSTGEKIDLHYKIHLPPGPTFSSNVASWRQGAKPEPRVISITLPKGHSYSLVKIEPSNSAISASLKPGYDQDAFTLTIVPSTTDQVFNSVIDLRTSNGKIFTIFANIVPSQPAANP